MYVGTRLHVVCLGVCLCACTCVSACNKMPVNRGIQRRKVILPQVFCTFPLQRQLAHDREREREWWWWRGCGGTQHGVYVTLKWSAKLIAMLYVTWSSLLLLYLLFFGGFCCYCPNGICIWNSLSCPWVASSVNVSRFHAFARQSIWCAALQFFLFFTFQIPLPLAHPYRCSDAYLRSMPSLI